MNLKSVCKVLAVALALSTSFVCLAKEPLHVPEKTDDGWPVGTLESAGIDRQGIEALLAAIRAGELSNIHSVLIVRDGRLVFDAYFRGSDERRGDSLGEVEFDLDTLHDLRSVTKSATSTLTGIAVGQGLLDIEAPIGNYLPSHQRNSVSQQISIEDLLTMRSGLAWDERTYPYTDPRNSETAMDLSNSSVEYVLSQPLSQTPGEQFSYCGGCTMLLSAAITHASGMALDDWAAEVLFEPLGISRYEWLRHQDGLAVAASGLRLRPRDLAKIGFLYLNEGRWQGQEVVPAGWIRESIRNQVPLDERSAYGFQWWVDLEPLNDEIIELPVARGNGGQRIYLVPPLSLMAVITAGNYNRAESRHSELVFWRHILPAATGN